MVSTSILADTQYVHCPKLLSAREFLLSACMYIIIMFLVTYGFPHGTITNVNLPPNSTRSSKAFYTKI